MSDDLFGYEDLKVFKLAFKLAMEIFELSKDFPQEEKYSLTDQVRRSSRSVCANIAEGYRKRSYPKYFAAKLIDSDGECSETVVHLKFAFHCKYLDEAKYDYFKSGYTEVGRMLGSMIKSPEKFLPKT